MEADSSAGMITTPINWNDPVAAKWTNGFASMASEVSCGCALSALLSPSGYNKWMECFMVERPAIGLPAKSPGRAECADRGSRPPICPPGPKRSRR